MNILTGKKIEKVVVVTTAQYRQMLDQVLKPFKITPSHDLDVMENDQTLSSITAKIIEKFDPIVRKQKPDWIVVQGDAIPFLTLTAPEGSLRALMWKL